ncbi:phosphoribosylformylglycinamidine cyclo-ligase [soil metagenome]
MSDHAELTYAASGVDIDASEELLRLIGPAIARTQSDRVIRGIGHFGGFYRIGPAGENLTLVASIDGVGTKLKVASLANRHDGIGHDIVNHCVNDILACGARPICFLDYFATGSLNVDTAKEVIGGIAEACEQLGVALLGGETAEMPGIYRGKDYDVAGVILGLVDRDEIVDGTSIRNGDILVGLPSSGFHTNGYSLIRAVLGLNEDDGGAQHRLLQSLPWDVTRTIAEALLEPHRSYLEDVTDALEIGGITGMAHITGGGIAGNLGRIIPVGLSAEVDCSAWNVPRLMTYVAELGHVSAGECYRVFNMGVGFVLVCGPDRVSELLKAIDGSFRIGQIVSSAGDERVRMMVDQS